MFDAPLGGMTTMGAQSPLSSGLEGAPQPMGGGGLDPMMMQMLLLQLQQDGLEGGMPPEEQVMAPDPMEMLGLGGMGQLPPAFAGAQDLAQTRLPGPIGGAPPSAMPAAPPGMPPAGPGMSAGAPPSAGGGGECPDCGGAGCPSCGY